MKKRILWLLILSLVCLLALPVSAAETPSYAFELSVNGQDTVETKQGEILTVMVHLRRTDAAEASSIHAMQAELRYDPAFLEVVEGGSSVYSGVTTRDIALLDGQREYYLNFLSMSGGSQWPAETLVGSVQFRVLADSGVSKISNEDFMVSLPDGSGSYECSSNQLLLILSTECTVSFQSNGGTAVEPLSGFFGEKLAKPADPSREGYRFLGWYKDIYLTQAWDFDKDLLQGNVTLYAKWEGEAVEEVEAAPPAMTEEGGSPAAEALPEGEGMNPLLLTAAPLLLILGYVLYRKKRG